MLDGIIPFMTERDQNGKTEKNIASENTVDEPILISNPTLDVICTKIEEKAPDWEYLMQAVTPFIQSPRVSTDQLLGILAELHIHHQLEDIIHIEGMEDKCTLDPISNAKMDTYRLTKKKEGALIASASKIDVAEYDALMEIDGLPTVFEVKAKDSMGLGRTSIRETLRPSDIKKRFRPLQEYYGFNTFGYVVITGPKTASLDYSPSINSFRERGGKLIAMTLPFDEALRRMQDSRLHLLVKKFQSQETQMRRPHK